MPSYETKCLLVYGTKCHLVFTKFFFFIISICEINMPSYETKCLLVYGTKCHLVFTKFFFFFISYLPSPPHPPTPPHPPPPNSLFHSSFPPSAWVWVGSVAIIRWSCAFSVKLYRATTSSAFILYGWEAMLITTCAWRPWKRSVCEQASKQWIGSAIRKHYFVLFAIIFTLRSNWTLRSRFFWKWRST